MGSTEAARHPNRLIDAISPYLLQHAYNPVDWYPWDAEALERARCEDKPIFLSIGYAACHWCHVMERESFENEAIAAFLNEHFVPIKVDREERPDLDDVYMKAVQLMTGSGGWPMSVFLTPDLEPFFAGTYYPPEDRPGMPGFPTVLNAVVDAWTSRRAGVVKSANAIRAALAQTERSPARTAPVSTTLITQAEDRLKRAFDPVEGGFETAPKFPSSLALGFLIERYRRTHDTALIAMATLTLGRMAHGGIRDHLGGGFHRYSTDAHWLVPHFEKMLYDNALLAGVYIDAWRVTRNPWYAQIARETLDYLLRDMRDADGAFHASEDADSEGEEGRFYLWTRDAIIQALGETDGHAFCSHYGVRAEGNFPSHEPYHTALNILHTHGGTNAHLAASRERLHAVRAGRVRPGRDDKVLVSWNALAISALARAGRFLDEPRYTQAAQRAAEFILSTMVRVEASDTVLYRVYRQNRLGTPGFLDDYAFLIVALADVYASTFGARWLEHADGLAHTMLDRFADPNGGFYLAASHDTLVARTKPWFDGVEPSGNSMAALGLWRLGRLLDRTSYSEAANRTLASASDVMGREPRAFLKLLAVADTIRQPPVDVSLVGSIDLPVMRAFLRVLNACEGPEPLVAAYDPAANPSAPVPVLAGKALVNGEPAAYVCRNGTCLPPAVTPEELQQQLA